MNDVKSMTRRKNLKTVYEVMATSKRLFLVYLQVGVCPLPDNNPEHNYVYQITVWTGLRRGGGTKSNVYFILSGLYRLKFNAYIKIPLVIVSGFHWNSSCHDSDAF